MDKNSSDQLQTIQQLLSILTNKDMSTTITEELKKQAQWWLKIKINEYIGKLNRNDPLRVELQNQIDSLYEFDIEQQRKKRDLKDSRSLEPIMENSFDSYTTIKQLRAKHTSPESKTVKRNLKTQNSSQKKRLSTDTDFDTMITHSAQKSNKSQRNVQPFSKSPQYAKVRIDSVDSFSLETQSKNHKIEMGEQEFKSISTLRDNLSNQVNKLRNRLSSAKRQRDGYDQNAKILCNNNDMVIRSNQILNKELTSHRKCIQEIRQQIQQLEDSIVNNKIIIITDNETLQQETKLINTYQNLMAELNSEVKNQKQHKYHLKSISQQNEKTLQIQKSKIELMSKAKQHVMESVEYQLNQFDQSK